MDYSVEIYRKAKQHGLENAVLHIIFDGRSTDPGSAPALPEELEAKLDGIGRGLVLDRDGNYGNVKLVYDMMTE